MARMIAEVYDALLAAGSGEEKARKAAEVLASQENRFARIEADLLLLKWIGGTNTALILLVLGLSLFS